MASEYIINELKEQKQNQDIFRKLLDKAYNKNGLVSCYDDGSMIHPGTLSHLFEKELSENNLPHIRFHDLRHTNATLMLKAGIPAKVASERLGHANIGITMDLYSHVLNELQREAANKLDNQTGWKSKAD